MTSILSWILGLSGWPVPAVIAGLVFAESALFVGFLIPGETALLLGGALSAEGHLRLPLLITLAAAAAVAGDSVGYAVGHRFGPRLLSTRLGRRIQPARWQSVVSFTARRGGWAVFGGRWTALLRALVPAAAGTALMPYRSFLVFNFLGGLTWAMAVSLLGYSAGASIAGVAATLSHLSLVIGGLVVVAIAWHFRHRWGRSQRRQTP